MAAVAGVPAELLSRRPPGDWRAGEIGEHLYFYRGTVKGLAGVTAAGKPLATNQQTAGPSYPRTSYGRPMEKVSSGARPVSCQPIRRMREATIEE
jgi:hypothetical protein